MARHRGADPLSVRPIMEIEEDMFQRMMEPFNPTEHDEEGSVTSEQHAKDDSQKNHEETEVVQPRIRMPPTQPSPEDV